MRVAKVVSVIAKRPGCAEPPADAVSVFTKSQWWTLKHCWNLPSQSVQTSGHVCHDTNGVSHLQRQEEKISTMELSRNLSSIKRQNREVRSQKIKIVIPVKSRSRQSNETTVDASCTIDEHSEESTWWKLWNTHGSERSLELREKHDCGMMWSATSRTTNIRCAATNNNTRDPTWEMWQNCKWQKKLRHFF